MPAYIKPQLLGASAHYRSMLALNPKTTEFLVLLLFLYIVKRCLFRYYGKGLPPGPPGYPIIGNIFDVPSERQWIAYRDISKRYCSDIIGIKLWGTPLIVVNSLEAANDLFRERSSNYSDRPRFTMVNELVGFTWNLGFMPYGNEWKENRKGFRQELNPRKVVHYRPSMISATEQLLRRLLDKPDDFMRHLRYMAGTTVLSIAYGIQVQPENDPFIEIAERANHALVCATNSGSYLVDQLPFLKYVPEWFPGAGFKRQAKEWCKDASAMPILAFDFVKDAMAKGDFVPSVASRYLENLAAEHPNESGSSCHRPEAEKLLSNVLATIYIAGADTTVSALASFILGLVKNPDAQRKGQLAVDELTGGERLPDFSDIESVPYIDALLREALRWNPVVPLGIPHKSIEDDVYNGYYIPGGTTIIANGWAMLHDEATYGPNPHLFNPDRFLKEDGTLDPNVPFPEPAFGFGKRTCSGRELGVASIWISIACILACFDVTKAVDEDGNVIEPSGEYTSGFLCYPLPFKCSIRPRSKRAEEMIRHAKEVDGAL
ncbi:hypothetical protein D9758_017428 [Tetrapyrgos nigripes]|uniref:Cytochrome P450 n=1 Tax=Tetrapyrgos nigripes TaxID=182062 RepID=A0A8H5C2J9_9AGAR|nr:hypothetical protein D9758_017428 [Tetrapyrgos nigripes]